MNKLRTNRGETLVETLISILIVAISVAFLVTSVTVASRINAKVRDAVSSKMSFTYDDARQLGKGSMAASGILDATDEISVKIYQSNGYYYYIKGE